MHAMMFLLLLGACAGAGRLAAYAVHPEVPHPGDVAAMVLTAGCIAGLAVLWGGPWLDARRRDLAAKREARRATLIKHADPLSAEVERNAAILDEHDKLLGEVAAESRATAGQVAYLLAALADVLRTADVPAPDLDVTSPMLRLVAGGRDSA